ncbi:MAG TPA: hypothetical protein ENG83_11200 [Nitrospirae bacterium]|nr:hypothetical protein BMS3Abin06_01476 [bacterium BMS3Abin06]HDH12740.1 hypothetical protein [Nitrospirota bacterium]HDZ00049.1 hypothetical protein [Nitrospirota bacterium]
MISGDVYLSPVLNNAPRLLGLLNRNISSSSYGSFDREYWHYNTVDFSCARKQEAVLTLTLLYLIKHEKNRYYQNKEILGYIRAALMFWTRIQNKNGSFNEWYPNENSFVVTSFSTYAVSESLLLIKDELPENEHRRIINALMKAGDWLVGRHEKRVMNQQTGAAIALLNLYLLTDKTGYLDSSKDKISLLNQRQSDEGWFVEYGGPDIGYLSLAIDYLCKYYSKTEDNTVKEIVVRSLSFIKYFIQPNLIAGGEYTSRNTEYLIPHGFEIFSKINEDALFLASVVRKSLLKPDSFPNFFDDRYLTYVGYTWLQAYLDANPELNETADNNINGHFNKSFKKHFDESGLLIINDEHKHMIMNMKKGASFRLFDKKAGRAYSDSGILVNSGGKWYTSGWLAEIQKEMDEDSITVSGNMWKVPDKTLSPLSNILLRLFQMTFGRSSFISLWMKERLRDILITKTKPSDMRYNRTVFFIEDSNELLKVMDSVSAEKNSISSVAVFAKDTHIYVPSSRYYVDMKDSPFQRFFSNPVRSVEIEWKIKRDSGVEFSVNK